MPEESLLKLADAMSEKQLQRAEGLSFDALLLYLDILQARGKLKECSALLEGRCKAGVHMPHELSRLKVRCLPSPDDRQRVHDYEHHECPSSMRLRLYPGAAHAALVAAVHGWF
jgi:hypothetical protein